MRVLDSKQPAFWMALLGVVVIVNAVVLARTLAVLATYEARVSQTIQSISQIERTLSVIKDAESGQRGFLLTGDETYLVPYQAAQLTIDEQLQQVSSAVSQSAAQRARVERLTDAVDRRMELLQGRIDVYRSTGAVDEPGMHTGQELMANIRTLVAEIEAEERAVLDERRREASAGRTQLGIAFALTTGVALLFLTISGITLTRAAREREQAAERLRDQREWLAVTLGSIGDAVIATDTATRITFMNSVAEELTGWTLAECTDRPVSEVFQIINEDTRQPTESPITRVLREGKVVGLANHTLLLRRDGSEIPIDDSGAPIRSGSGAILGVVLVFRDITNQKRVEREQQLLVDANLALASSLDYDDTLDAVARLVMPRFADLCVVFALEGQTIRRVLSVHIEREHETELRALQSQLIDADGPHPAAQVMRSGDVMLNPVLSQELLQMLAQDSEQVRRMRGLIPLSQIIVPLTARQRTIGAVSFGRLSGRTPYDESELPLAEELARRTALALDNARLYGDMRAAVQVRDAFLSTAAHELRTPLTSLLGQIQLLQRRSQRDDPLTERGQRSLAVIAEQSSRLNRMIAAMLDVSRLEGGQLQLSREPVDLGALTRQVVEELLPTLHQHQIVCSAETATVSGDALRLEQVIQNLVGNAIKYSPHGGQVKVTVAAAGDTVQLTVRDEGIGIPADALPQLFQRFYRASNTTGHHIAGIGIGLYVVREIVQMHGGSIEVESVEGEGSAFTVTLPTLDAAPSGALSISGAGEP